MPKGFAFLILAQFFSGLADNAFLLLGIFFLAEQGYSPWWAPLLKVAFTLSYVAFASVVGPVADGFQKRHVMWVMNMLKLLALLVLLAGAHPVLAFALTGFAASVYAPAKYGLMVETVHPTRLVQANAWLEVSVVLSVLGGLMLGAFLLGANEWRWGVGGLVGVDLSAGLALLGMTWLAPAGWVDTQIAWGLGVVAGVYLCSALLQLGMGQLRSPQQPRWAWSDMRVSAFWSNHLLLWRDPLGRVSLRVTSLCWGVGAVLQFVVLVWAEKQAGLTLQQGAYLQGLVALGVIGGAGMAAVVCRLSTTRRQVFWAFVLAALLPCLALIHSVWLALPLLLTAGWAGGMLLVPMNALLQHRGQQLMPTGRSIAVQGFNENLGVMVMLGFYSVLLAWEIPLLAIMLFLSVVLCWAVMPYTGLAKRQRASALR